MKFFVGGGAARAYTDERVDGLLDAAPEALNTLNELAAALNDDANFASTVTNALASAETAANDYTDSEISSAVSALESYADQAEADAISTAASDATSKANAAESAAIAAAQIPRKADPDAVYAGGYDTVGQLVYVESEETLWILSGGTDGSESTNWLAFVRGSTVGITTTSSFATTSTVDDAVGSLISPLLLAGM